MVQLQGRRGEQESDVPPTPRVQPGARCAVDELRAVVVRAVVLRAVVLRAVVLRAVVLQTFLAAPLKPRVACV